MRKVVYLLLVGAAMYLAAMYRSTALLSLSLAAALLFLVLFVITKWQARTIEASFASPVFLHAGTTRAPIRLKIRTRGFFPMSRGKIRLRLRYEGEKKDRRLSAWGSAEPGAQEWVYPLQAPLYGLANVRMRRIRLYDPLGLFSGSRKQQNTMKLAVFPDLASPAIHDSFSAAKGAPLEESGSVNELGTGGDIHQIRPYHAGDSIKQVHWKLSSRFEDLVVKDWEEEASRMVTFQIEKKARFTTAEQASDFYEQLSSRIAGFLTQGFHVRAVWTEPDGKSAEEILIKKEDLNRMLLKLYDSRWCFTGGSGHA